MPWRKNFGLVLVRSRHSVGEAAQRLETAFAGKGLQVFALIDHRDEAHNSSEYLQERHGVPADLIKNLAGAGVLIEKAVE